MLRQYGRAMPGVRIVSQPDGAQPGQRGECVVFTQFVAGPDLAMNREGYRKIYSVCPVASSTRLKGTPGKAPDAPRFGDVAEFGSEIEKSCLVLDGVLIEALHG